MANDKLEAAIQAARAAWENEYGQEVAELYKRKAELEELIRQTKAQIKEFESTRGCWEKERDARDIIKKKERELRGVHDLISHNNYQLEESIRRVQDEMCKHVWGKEEYNFFADYITCTECGQFRVTLDYDPGYE